MAAQSATAKAAKAYSELRKTLPDLRRSYSAALKRRAEIDDSIKQLRKQPLTDADLQAALTHALEARQKRILESEGIAQQLGYVRRAAGAILDGLTQDGWSDMAPFSISRVDTSDIETLLGLLGDPAALAERIMASVQLPAVAPGPSLEDRRTKLDQLTTERTALADEIAELEEVLVRLGEDLTAWHTQAARLPREGDTRVNSNGEREVFTRLPSASAELQRNTQPGWLSESAARKSKITFPAGDLDPVPGFDAGISLEEAEAAAAA
ncbi:hypothetical protein CKO42_20970 [Lamprobacter modestohalophilus]|uniref:Uncharacterized protein n=1 Tax=Lamprobacter modestohalophilus TaxID=1064514 RepID=A0A9X0WD75_9GAMM|nr:hypothetical protein [Lamprobacter modestohalophilus]MBK1620853.1 hypothetical protein [Lamprobacter modestohalophilus]